MDHSQSFKEFLTITAFIFALVALGMSLLFLEIPFWLKVAGSMAAATAAGLLIFRVVKGNRQLAARRSIALGLLAIGSACIWSVIGGQSYRFVFFGYEFLYSTTTTPPDTWETVAVLFVSLVAIILAAKLMMYRDPVIEKMPPEIFPKNWVKAAEHTVRSKNVDDIASLHRRLSDELFVDTRQLTKSYVEPDIQFVNPADYNEDNPVAAVRVPVRFFLEKFLTKKFIERDGSQVLFVLSDAGMGKTSLLAMLALNAINAKNWPKDVKFEFFKLGLDTLSRVAGLSDKSNTVLVLDSLDEDQSTLDGIEERLERLVRDTRSFRQVIISVRTQFFPTERSAVLESSGAIKIGGHRCSLIYLAPFTDKQVDDFLSKVYPKSFINYLVEWFTGRDSPEITMAKVITSRMKSMRLRPMLLQHIDRLAARMMDGRDLNEYDVYDELVMEWLDREERKPNGPRASNLIKACTQLSLALQTKRDRKISAEDFAAFCSHNDLQSSLEKIEITGRSLVNKTSWGEWRFAHYSIQEFLVSRWLFEEASRHVKTDYDRLLRSGERIYATDLMVSFLSSRRELFWSDASLLSIFNFEDTKINSYTLNLNRLVPLMKYIKSGYTIDFHGAVFRFELLNWEKGYAPKVVFPDSFDPKIASASSVNAVVLVRPSSRRGAEKSVVETDKALSSYTLTGFIIACLLNSKSGHTFVPSYFYDEFEFVGDSICENTNGIMKFKDSFLNQVRNEVVENSEAYGIELSYFEENEFEVYDRDGAGFHEKFAGLFAAVEQAATLGLDLPLVLANEDERLSEAEAATPKSLRLGWKLGN